MQYNALARRKFDYSQAINDDNNDDDDDGCKTQRDVVQPARALPFTVSYC